MTLSTYIEKRNNIFYFIRHIPKKYQSIFQKKRIKISLKTSDKELAQIKASHLNSDFVTLIMQLDNTLIFQEKNRLKSFGEKENNMMHLILNDVDYVNKTVGRIELNPEKLDEELALLDKFQNKLIQPSQSATVIQSSLPDEPESNITVQNLIDNFSDEKISSGQWPEKRRKEIGAIFNLLTRVYGKDISAGCVTKKMASEFKQMIMKLPKNINGTANKERYFGKSLAEIIEMGDEPMSTTNVNKYLGNLSTLFQWGEDNGYLSKNPFNRLKVKKNNKKKNSEERDRYTDEDLINIHNEIYSKTSLKAYMYWLPLMELYSGSRLREFAQLYLDDIYEINGIWVFDINENAEDKSVKSANSIRLIPIHKKLIDLGLLGYVGKLKKKGEIRLFPELKYRREGYATTPSSWFNRIRDRMGMAGLKPMKDFHSYRHTFTDHLKQKGYPEEQVSAITGHGTGGITFNRYGKDYNTELLFKLMNDVDFDHVMKNVPKFSDANINYNGI